MYGLFFRKTSGLPTHDQLILVGQSQSAIKQAYPRHKFTKCPHNPSEYKAPVNNAGHYIIKSVVSIQSV